MLFNFFKGKCITSLCWRPDGKAVAVGLEDGTISLHDVEVSWSEEFNVCFVSIGLFLNVLSCVLYYSPKVQNNMRSHNEFVEANAFPSPFTFYNFQKLIVYAQTLDMWCIIH